MIMNDKIKFELTQKSYQTIVDLLKVEKECKQSELKKLTVDKNCSAEAYQRKLDYIESINMCLLDMDKRKWIGDKFYE
tara:strand:+ start:318 stop:551 length:234 start_codon:yes stop_codon:yes gene_type:complete